VQPKARTAIAQPRPITITPASTAITPASTNNVQHGFRLWRPEWEMPIKRQLRLQERMERDNV